MATSRQPVLAMCHGGGPMPLLSDPGHHKLMKMWAQHRREFFGFTYPEAVRSKYTLGNTKAPKGVIVLSAHDVSGATAGGVPVVRVGTNPTPTIEYDYYGFPDRGLVYTVKYPVHGPDATIASEVVTELESKLGKLLAEPGTKARPMKIETNPKSKFDHGVFIPMLYLMPVKESNHRDADLIDADDTRMSAADLPPVITISSFHSQNAADHIQLGKMISGLRDMGYLVLGSGTSSHVFSQVAPSNQGLAFNTALSKTLTNPDIPTAVKEEFMLNFLSIDGANEAQRKGQADHFMPWLTCFGVGIGSGSSFAKEIANVPMGTWHQVHHLW